MVNTALTDVLQGAESQFRRHRVFGFKVGKTLLIVAGCSLLSLSFAGDANSRNAQRDEARSKVQSPKMQARKGLAVPVKREASAEEEPFCVRPFEYPRKAR
jgi:hypothetical protein